MAELGFPKMEEYPKHAIIVSLSQPPAFFVSVLSLSLHLKRRPLHRAKPNADHRAKPNAYDRLKKLGENHPNYKKKKIMPSLQTALPPELANNVIRLYRECLRRAKYIGSQQYNTELVVDMVRQQFRKHIHETDPEKIQKLKDDAARGLINHMLHESERLSGRKFSKS